MTKLETKEETICEILGTELLFYIESRKKAKKILNILNKTIGNNKIKMIYKKDGVITMTITWKTYRTTVKEILYLRELNLFNVKTLLKDKGILKGDNRYLGCAILYGNLNKDRVEKEIDELLKAA